ncbi:MAG: cyclic nucleotide-binding/CBS domain-containing protein [Nitrospirales bacterium]|nr:cyclic nucleotide-binding/CBS domain-containing protein [Nitrospirales bacterium]
MILEDVISFLKRVPPFQFLDESVLREVAGSISLEFYPANTLVLRQDGPPSEFLRIIKKGGVKVSMGPENGEEVVIDYRGEGDNFGFLSLVGKDKVRSNVRTVEDTICYLIHKDVMTKLMDTNPVLTEYFLKSHLTKYIDRTYSEMHSKSLFYGGSDRLLFTTQIGDIAIKEIIRVDEGSTIQEAAQAMALNKVSSVIIADSKGLPVGIVTDRDLRDKVVAKGRDVSESIRNIMSLPLIRVDARDYCFEAVLKMIRHNVHHMLVVKDGELRGVITNHDLMLMQGASPLSFAKDIENQQTIEGLIPVSTKINRVVGLLLKEGAKASNITKIITELNDRLVKKVLEIAERKMGTAPVPYCWIVFGSEGRKEQTFKTDQDNAIIYDDPKSEGHEAEIREYFNGFTAFVRDALLKCGFPLCPADFMASNPRWCQSLQTWKKNFKGWVATPTADAVLNSVTFFDFRPIYGELGLAETLRDYLISLVKDQKVFLGYIANLAIKNRPPLGFLGNFVVDKGGEHKDELNLKIKGIAPLVDMVRLFALEKGIRETSTLERIAALKDKHSIVREHGEEIGHALDFIMLLRIQLQFEQIKTGKTPDNFINPNRLSNLEKKSAKEAFHLITRIQDMIIELYKSMIW